MKKRILCYIGKTVAQKGFYLGNSGNFLFNMALESFLDCDRSDVTFHSLPEFFTDSSDYVNQNFDMVLYSTANIINSKCTEFFISANGVISKYKIPIFFIGAGLETSLDDVEYKFIEPFKAELCAFIGAVQNCGGVFSLRGYMTVEIFKKLGFDNYYVTGCPSLFMKGANLRISPKALKQNELKILINGTHSLCNKKINHVFKTYPDSTFICQDRFIRVLEERNKYPIRYCDLALYFRFGLAPLQLLKQNRIKLFKDIPDWLKYFKENGFNFSFGSRIHGNIIALLSEIPVFIHARNMRVLEMAEYFNIPHATSIDKKINYHKLYQSLDYTEFNTQFQAKFDNFQKFFDMYDIPCKVGKGIETFLY